jgi:FHA domain-containing protein
MRMALLDGLIIPAGYVMRFTIISTKLHNQPPESYCDFYAPGGTIGRGTDNNLVLPDNERTISRLQAIIHVDAQGACRVTNCGSVTRVMLNDITLERSQQVELKDGDILGIDDYRIKVTALDQGLQPIHHINTNIPTHPARPPEPKPEPEVASALKRDEIAPTAVPLEIWDSLMQEFSISDSLSSNRMKPQPAATHDPFTQPKSPERNAEDPLAMFANREPQFEHKNVDTDALFSDDALFKTKSIFNDVTPTTLMVPEDNQSSLPKEEADELDPLALFGGSASAPVTRTDDPLGLMGGTPLTHPDDITPEESVMTQEPAILSTPPIKAVEASPSKDEQRIQDYAGFARPTPQAAPRNNTPQPKGRLRIDPIHHAASGRATPCSTTKNEVLQGELLEALLDGMGLSEMQPVPQFDPENMRQIGQILSMFSQGTVALLSSRSILKRGVKADMTMVLDDANNPFKLLPSGKTVLIQMFGTPMPGFMPPKKSVRDALIDLQAHQLGMISGIRAIIAAMLQSFNPQQLEEQAKLNGGVPSRLSLPGSRKAALWDYYVRSYGETAGEIEDDFHTLFGEAFLHAYDMEVNQYKDSQSGSEE